MLALVLMILLILPFSMAEPYAKAFLDRSTYGPGAIIYGTITDRNFNRSTTTVESIDLTQIVDNEPIVEIRVTQPTKGMFVLSAVDGSLKDEAGRPVTEAVETHSNTSVFEFLAKLPDDLEPNSSVTIIYNDPFELAPTNRSSIPVERKLTLVETGVKDKNGKPLISISVGEQVMFKSTIQSSLNVKQQYAYIVQVKDSNGYTVVLSWLSGYLDPKRSASTSIAWVPDAIGKYTLEIWVEV